MLIDDDLLLREGARWVASAGLREVPVPQSVQLLVASRLDRLPPAELTVLECASVEGTLFHREPTLVAVTEHAAGDRPRRGAARARREGARSVPLRPPRRATKHTVSSTC